MQHKKLLLLAALSFIPTLWLYTIGEEGIYTISSLEMWQSKEWLIQSMYGISLQRPPLMNWIVVGVCNLIGWSHVVEGIRLVSVAATLGIASLLYWLCNKLFNDRSFALFATLSCLSLLDLLLYRGWLAYTDPLFAFFTFGAIATLWVATIERRGAWLIISIILISCAFLTKALTAYVFYMTAASVLLIQRNQRSFLLSPPSLLILLSILITPVIWMTSIPQLHGQDASLLHEITLKLSATDKFEYLVRVFFDYPLDVVWRLSPISLIALYLLFRKRVLQPETEKEHYKSAIFIAALTIAPYWLAPQGGIRYLLPIYPIVALLGARIVWRAGESVRHWTTHWFAAVIALKWILVLVFFPYYQTHVRGENYVISARHIAQKTAGFPLYAQDFRSVAESIVTQIDIDRLPSPAVKAPPSGWGNGFLISPDADQSKGQVVEEMLLGGDKIYLLCRGLACRPSQQTPP